MTYRDNKPDPWLVPSAMTRRAIPPSTRVIVPERLGKQAVYRGRPTPIGRSFINTVRLGRARARRIIVVQMRPENRFIPAVLLMLAVIGGCLFYGYGQTSRLMDMTHEFRRERLAPLFSPLPKNNAAWQSEAKQHMVVASTPKAPHKIKKRLTRWQKLKNWWASR